MSYVRDTAIVLKNDPFREHDAWITMYGRTHGKLAAVARGSRRMQAKHLGHLEPFSEIEVLVAKGQAFDKLAVARALRTRPALRQSLGGLATSGALADLVERLTRPGVADVLIYDLLTETVSLAEEMPQEPTAERARLLFAAGSLKLIDALGYAPSFRRNAECGEDALRLIRFLRERPLADLLRLTASVGLFRSACLAIEEALSVTPLFRRPHGATTVVALLS